jgi:hypothetical protein
METGMEAQRNDGKVRWKAVAERLIIEDEESLDIRILVLRARMQVI